MNRRMIWTTAALILCACLAGYTIGHAAGDMPPGIRESQWKPLSPDLGLVLEKAEGGRVKAHLMCKLNGKWLPVSIQNQAAVEPAQ